MAGPIGCENLEKMVNEASVSGSAVCPMAPDCTRTVTAIPGGVVFDGVCLEEATRTPLETRLAEIMDTIKNPVKTNDEESRNIVKRQIFYNRSLRNQIAHPSLNQSRMEISLDPKRGIHSKVEVRAIDSSWSIPLAFITGFNIDRNFGEDDDLNIAGNSAFLKNYVQAGGLVVVVSPKGVEAYMEGKRLEPDSIFLKDILI